MLAPVVHWFLRQRAAQMEAWIDYPIDAQQNVFRNLIQAAKDTEWGRKYDFASIKYPGEFTRRVPVQDYESLKPCFQRIMNGEQNILWNTPIKWFAKSSGTTSDKSKFIPLSKEAIEDCHFKGGIDLVAAASEQRCLAQVLLDPQRKQQAHAIAAHVIR